MLTAHPYICSMNIPCKLFWVHSSFRGKPHWTELAGCLRLSDFASYEYLTLLFSYGNREISSLFLSFSHLEESRIHAVYFVSVRHSKLASNDSTMLELHCFLLGYHPPPFSTYLTHSSNFFMESLANKLSTWNIRDLEWDDLVENFRSSRCWSRKFTH